MYGERLREVKLVVRDGIVDVARKGGRSRFIERTETVAKGGLVLIIKHSAVDAVE